MAAFIFISLLASTVTTEAISLGTKMKNNHLDKTNIFRPLRLLIYQMRCYRNKITFRSIISSMKWYLQLTNWWNFSTSLAIFASDVSRFGFLDRVVYFCLSVHELSSPWLDISFVLSVETLVGFSTFWCNYNENSNCKSSENIIITLFAQFDVEI